MATSVGSGTSMEAEFPTLQFAESVKSFVSKCQALCISTEEYRLMKLIALFQSAGQLHFFYQILFWILNLVFISVWKLC